MADNELREFERRFLESGSYEDLVRFMRGLDQAGSPYVVPVERSQREGRWFETPIADLEFGESSKGYLGWTDAWEFAKGQGGVLQSLGEAVIRRFVLYKDNQSRGTDLNQSDTYQVTRTMNLKFFDKGRYWSAFAELPDDRVSLDLLAQGFDESGAGRDLVRSYDDPLIAGLLEQARGSNRIRSVQKKDGLYLSTQQQDGSSEYGRHSNLIAVFGDQLVPELNAFYLQQREKHTGYLWDLTEDAVKYVLKGKKGSHVLVRPVGLGGVVVDAVIRFGDYGCASPVVHAKAGGLVAQEKNGR